MIRVMASGAAPLFYLYGERPRPVDGRFVHVEALDDRSRPSEWTIQPHSHADLHHVFLLRVGAGELTADGAVLDFRAPCLLLVPAGAVHGFGFEAESAGMVLTVAEAYLRELQTRAPMLADVFVRAAVLDPGVQLGEAASAFDRLQRELALNAPGQGVAIEAAMLGLLVLIMRLRHAAERWPNVGLNRDAELVAAFRLLLSRRTADRLSLPVCARELGVSTGRLQRACRAVAGRGPLALAQEHRLQAARRLLAYSTLSVAQVGYSLGIEDAPYFTRLFTRGEGVSPRAYRRRLRDQMG